MRERRTEEMICTAGPALSSVSADALLLSSWLFLVMVFRCRSRITIFSLQALDTWHLLTLCTVLPPSSVPVLPCSIQAYIYHPIPKQAIRNSGRSRLTTNAQQPKLGNHRGVDCRCLPVNTLIKTFEYLGKPGSISCRATTRLRAGHFGYYVQIQ